MHLQWQRFRMSGIAAGLGSQLVDLGQLPTDTEHGPSFAISRWRSANFHGALTCFSPRENTFYQFFCHLASYECPSTRARLSRGPFLVRFRPNGRLVRCIFFADPPPSPLSRRSVPAPPHAVAAAARRQARQGGSAAKWRRAPLGKRVWLCCVTLPVCLEKAAGALARGWSWRLWRGVWVQSSSPPSPQYADTFCIAVFKVDGDVS